MKINKEDARRYGYKLITLGKEIMGCGEKIVEKSNEQDSEKEIVKICRECSEKAYEAKLTVLIIKKSTWALVSAMFIAFFGCYLALSVFNYSQGFVAIIAAMVAIMVFPPTVFSCLGAFCLKQSDKLSRKG